MARRRRLLLALCLLTSSTSPVFSASASETVQYRYDERGRLIQVHRSGDVNNGIVSSYGYDKADNRTNVTVTVPAPPIPPQLTLLAGQSAFSQDGRFQLIMQTDGNLCLYGPDGYMWCAMTHGGSDRRMVMQGDGNLVVYNGSNLALWHSGTGGNSGAYLSLQNDGNMVIYSASNAFLWHTNTPYSPPSFAINDTSGPEGGNLVFTVTRSKATTATYTVNFSTANGSATAGSDYYGGSGSISFAPSETTKSITVGTIDDAAVEGAETLYVNLTGASGGGTIGDGQGLGTINDNDVAPAVFSISDGTEVEGQTIVLTVTRSGTTTTAVGVNFGTANNSAVAGQDYNAASGTLSFAANETSKTISVYLRTDASAESAETFFVNLSGVTGSATISDSQAVVTILDDPPPEQCYDEGGRPILGD